MDRGQGYCYQSSMHRTSPQQRMNEVAHNINNVKIEKLYNGLSELYDGRVCV